MQAALTSCPPDAKAKWSRNRTAADRRAAGSSRSSRSTRGGRRWSPPRSGSAERRRLASAGDSSRPPAWSRPSPVSRSSLADVRNPPQGQRPDDRLAGRHRCRSTSRRPRPASVLTTGEDARPGRIKADRAIVPPSSNDRKSTTRDVASGGLGGANGSRLGSNGRSAWLERPADRQRGTRLGRGARDGDGHVRRRRHPRRRPARDDGRHERGRP